MDLLTTQDLVHVSLEERLARISALDLEPLAFKLTEPQYGRPSTMTDEEADIAIGHYRQTLKLWVRLPEQIITVTPMVDEVWHTHVLDTTKYSQDMVWALGYVPQHYPYFGAQGPVEHKRLMAAFETTKPLYADFDGDPVEVSAEWQRNWDRRLREFYLSRAVSKIELVGKCGTVRCCNACNKVHDSVMDPTTEFGPRMRRPGR